MTDLTIHDEEYPKGRLATDEEIADLLAGAPTANAALNLLASLNAADGTPHLDIFNATRNREGEG